jgi:hypothetical protein
MSQPTIPQAVQNIASDTQVYLPPSFSRVELTAAIFTAYRDNHGAYPDRHQFQAYSPAFVKSLPGDQLEAAVIIAESAAKLLGLPGIKTDAERVQHAREFIAQAKADVAEAEANRGQRLSRIHSLETQIADERRCLETWNIDFTGEAEKADRLIIENWGRTTVVAPFDTIGMLSVLKRLAPIAIKEIAGRIKALESELAGLKA